MEGKYLITTDAWFYAPDGKSYRAAWGEVEILSDSILGIKTNAKSSNWFAKIGSEAKHVVVAGCQIHYACKSKSKPKEGLVEDHTTEGGVVKYLNVPSAIYIAE
jgi:hypothetical protein